MLSTFLSDTSSTSLIHRRWLANGAFVLCGLQLLVLTQLWWKPALATTSIGRSLLSLEHLHLQSPAPLSIHIQEISQLPSKPEYWNLTISMENQTNAWVSFPHLVLSFLDDKKDTRFKNIWSPAEYASTFDTKALAPHTKQTIRVWLKLPQDVPSQYSLEYFYPY